MTQEQIDRVNRKISQPFKVTVIGETLVDSMIAKFGEEAVIDALSKSNVYINRRIRDWELRASKQSE